MIFEYSTLRPENKILSNTDDDDRWWTKGIAYIKRRVPNYF